MILSAGMDGMKNAKRLRPPIATEDDAAPLPKSLQESLDCLKHDEVLLSVLGPELRIAYIAVRESEAKNEKTLEEELATALARA
jgi:glutamine synthetase